MLGGCGDSFDRSEGGKSYQTVTISFLSLSLFLLCLEFFLMLVIYPFTTARMTKLEIFWGYLLWFFCQWEYCFLGTVFGVR